MSTEIVAIDGEEVEVEFDYEPPERPTQFYPGCPASWELLSGIWLSGPHKGEEVAPELLDAVAEDVIQQIIDNEVDAYEAAIADYEYEKIMRRIR